MKKTILLAFDFDGTLVESHEEVFAALKFSCQKLKITLPSIDELRNNSAKDLIGKMKLSPVQVFKLLRFSRSYLNNSTSEPKLYSGMSELLASLDPEIFDLHVVSTNSREKINKTLKKEGVDHLFSSVHGSLGIWSKRKALDKLARQLPMSQKLYVGDEERDIISAFEAGFEALSVGWGFKSPDLLQRFQPRYFVHHIHQFDRLLKSFA
jgi:phosphoglycolate phosphatase